MLFGQIRFRDAERVHDFSGTAHLCSNAFEGGRIAFALHEVDVRLRHITDRTSLRFLIGSRGTPMLEPNRSVPGRAKNFCEAHSSASMTNSETVMSSALAIRAKCITPMFWSPRSIEPM